MPEYIKNEHGLPIRQWPEKNKGHPSIEERMRQAARERRAKMEEACELDPDRSIHYRERLEALLQAMRNHSRYTRDPAYDYLDDGWY